MRSRKYFLKTSCLWIDVLRVQSRKNNSENLTLFSGVFKTENLKKNKKKLSFLSFFHRFYLKNTPHPALVRSCLDTQTNAKSQKYQITMALKNFPKEMWNFFSNWLNRIHYYLNNYGNFFDHLKKLIKRCLYLLFV